MQIAVVLIAWLLVENTALFLPKCTMNPIFLEKIILIILFGLHLDSSPKNTRGLSYA